MDRYVEYGYVDHTGRTVLYVLGLMGPGGDQDRAEFEEELVEYMREAEENEQPKGYVWASAWPGDSLDKLTRMWAEEYLYNG